MHILCSNESKDGGNDNICKALRDNYLYKALYRSKFVIIIIIKRVEWITSAVKLALATTCKEVKKCLAIKTTLYVSIEKCFALKSVLGDLFPVS